MVVYSYNRVFIRYWGFVFGSVGTPSPTYMILRGLGAYGNKRRYKESRVGGQHEGGVGGVDRKRPDTVRK